MLNKGGFRAAFIHSWRAIQDRCLSDWQLVEMQLGEGGGSRVRPVMALGYS